VSDFTQSSLLVDRIYFHRIYGLIPLIDHLVFAFQLIIQSINGGLESVNLLRWSFKYNVHSIVLTLLKKDVLLSQSLISSYNGIELILNLSYIAIDWLNEFLVLIVAFQILHLE
jgi:hypothetical protein